MNLLLNIREALRALKANKLRSTLTALEITFGVAAVVVMVAIGAGTHARIQQEIQHLGAKTLTVHPGSARTGGVRAGAGTRPTLTDDDARAIAAEVQDVVAVAPLLRGRAQIAAPNANWAALLNGTTDDFFRARHWPVAIGRTFLREESDMGRKVVILGRTVADELFGEDDPVGRTIRVNHLAFQVIGVLAAKGQTMDGSDLDDMVAVPLLTARNHLLGRSPGSAQSVSSIVVRAPDYLDLAWIVEHTRQLLRQRHRLAPDQEDDFVIRDMSEYLRMQEAASSALTVLLAAMASISLLVGASAS